MNRKVKAKDRAAAVEFVNKLIEQYTTAVKGLNELFEVAPDLCYKDDGVGCCNLDTATSRKGIVGPARSKLIRQRRSKLEKHDLTPHNACAYHKINEGCILDELKSPLCTAHYCKGELDDTKYGADYVFRMLKYLLNTEARKGNRKTKIESGWRIVGEVLDYADDIKREVSDSGIETSVDG